MRSLRGASIVLAGFVLAACSPASLEESPTTTLPAAEVSATESAPDTTTAPAVPATTSDRPLAPDFTLELGEGGTYTLSEGEKPVYLVFWAEW